MTGKIIIPLFFGFCLGAALPAAAQPSGGPFSLPLLTPLSGGGSATGGVFDLSGINMGGPTFSPSLPEGGDFSLMTGGTPAILMIETPKAGLGAAHCYPVPFRPSAGHTHITFTALTRTAVIRIYTVSGELVRTLEKSDSRETLDWDVKNSRGQYLASGVYFYTVKGAGQTATGKFMVIW